MNKIKILSDELINKIAAGEVLERPVSAVKELIENSLDANATKIDIYIRDGGRTEITVSDNGEGIRKDELKTAVVRHATSKLDSSRLNDIRTLGFRGEALSSLAGVSDFTLRSNPKSTSEGYEVNFISGEFRYLKPVRQKKGTLVAIRNLFFSTPARLKFLKKENYESLLVKKIVRKFSLINFNTEFNLYIDRKKILETKVSRNEIRKERFRDRVKDILGTEFLDNSIELREKEKKIVLMGLLGFPTFNHSNSNNQFVFVNGRIINDKSINTIFRVAYKDFLFHDRFPQLILTINCPFDWVDVNVHPMKNEVRFEDINFLRAFIINSFKSKLASIGHLTSSINSQKAIRKFSIDRDLQNDLILKENHEVKEKINDSENNIPTEDSFDNEKVFPLGYAKSQFHENYIISQTKTGIVIIDQHAAHERIVYEKLKKDFYENKIQRQILLIPVVIEVEGSIINDLKEKLGFLEKYGLKIELFGTNSLIVREIPIILSNCDVKKLTQDLIEWILDKDDFDSIEVEINKICSTMACHGSIRSGREMQKDEMNELLRKMENTPFSGQCNHGRPTYVELKLNEIEKLFGRK
ncbi:MAG: DNA mismatch repair endonuclease MutL [Pseudomonadota bacterium]|nr:DNA mismatch repair endonuclease MutL [Pseudomonadota bacterium]